MTELLRVRVELTGFVGGPGVSTFYTLDVATFLANLRTMYNNASGRFPDSVTFNFPNSGDTIEDTTGDIVGQWLGDVTAPVSGTDASAYPAPVGACITWLTGGIVASHRPRGRTFWVPLAGNVYQDDGTISTVALGELRSTAADFVTAQSSSFMVWSRPFAGKAATATKPARPARLGSSHLVTGSRVSDKAAVLRSRRD